MEFYTNVASYKNKLLVRGYRDGKRYKEAVHYKPYLFVPSQKTDTKYTSYQGRPVERLDFNSIWEARQFCQTYRDVEGFNIFGMTDYPYVFINDHYVSKNFSYDSSRIKVCVLDIEVEMGTTKPDTENTPNMVTAITMMYKDITIVFSYSDFVTDDKSIKYVKCKNEADLLKKFLAIWESDAYNPDVVTGWYIEFFDIPYLVNRIRLILGEDEAKRLSPWRILQEKNVATRHRLERTYVPVGVAVLDYFALYKKFTYNEQPTNTLNFISQVELGAQKIDYSEYGNLDDLYAKNPQLYLEYNIHDCRLVMQLEDKLGFLDLVYNFAYDSGINFVDALTSVRSWDVIIHNHLMKKNVVVPFKPESSTTRIPRGGHVKEPTPGLYGWSVSLDLTSLYPHLIMGYNISPETFRGMNSSVVEVDELLNGVPEYIRKKCKENNICFAASNAFYSRDTHGFLPELMQELFLKRKEYKDRMLTLQRQQEKEKNKKYAIEINRLDKLQHAIKIKLNSCYGALANQYFRWFDLRLAESITVSGQLTIRLAEKRLNEFMNKYLNTENIDYVLASDTDSLYVNMNEIVRREHTDLSDQQTCDALDAFCKDHFQPFLDETFEALASEMNCYKNAMFMKRELIANRILFANAKKRYALNVFDKEGVRYDTPKLKIVGFENVRSSTPAYARIVIERAIRTIILQDNDSLIELLKEIEAEFYTTPLAETSFPRSVNGLDKYRDSVLVYKEKTPIHVRGSLLYNKLVSDKKLRLPKIQNGDKIKYCYLKLPNPIHEDVIAYIDELPSEFGLINYVDWNTQFEKSIVSPISHITEAIGWELQKRHKISDFLF